MPRNAPASGGSPAVCVSGSRFPSEDRSSPPAISSLEFSLMCTSRKLATESGNTYSDEILRVGVEVGCARFDRHDALKQSERHHLTPPPSSQRIRFGSASNSCGSSNRPIGSLPKNIAAHNPPLRGEGILWCATRLGEAKRQVGPIIQVRVRTVRLNVPDSTLFRRLHSGLPSFDGLTAEYHAGSTEWPGHQRRYATS
jgi:hypothetical protein